MSKRFYAGIGSRKTPPHICAKMEFIAGELEMDGFILRTGDAFGADASFRRGVKSDEMKEIYGPDSLCETALEFGKRFHPAWNRLGEMPKALIARNTYQLFGSDFKTQSSFVVCWTPDGVMNGDTSEITGGTGQAIRIAAEYGIPVINLGNTKYVSYDGYAILEEINFHLGMPFYQ